MTSDQASGGLKHEYYHLQDQHHDPFQMTRPSVRAVKGSITLLDKDILISEKCIIWLFIFHISMQNSIQNTPNSLCIRQSQQVTDVISHKKYSMFENFE